MKNDNVSFLSYVEIHSRSERALFHIDDVTRFLELAGEDVSLYHITQFMSMHYKDIAHFLPIARFNANSRTNGQLVFPFAATSSG